MAPIDWGELLANAPQLATALLFGLFVLKLLERQDKQESKRDTEWRDYLTLGRDQYLLSVASMASEIKSLAAVVVSAHSEISQHDAWSKSEAIRRDAVTAATAAAVASEAVRVAAEVAARATELAIAKEKQSRGGRLE